jgi:phosphatidylserine/phosphatidylglycerophosphate/cardiolipin synthase-like enzyme
MAGNPYERGLKTLTVTDSALFLSHVVPFINFNEEAEQRLYGDPELLALSLAIGLVFTPLMDAITRGVELICMTHDAFNPSSMNSQAIERIRREAERVRGKVSVYTADIGQRQGREQHPLLHAKLFVIDRQAVVLGSANWTSYAFTKNFEAGVVLGADAAEECDAAIMWLIERHIVYLAFSTNPV